jgi:hypothetical protein
LDRLQLVLVSALWIGAIGGLTVTTARSGWVRGLARRDRLLLALCLVLALALRLAATTFPAAMSLVSAQASTVGDSHRWGAALSAVLHFLSLSFEVDLATVGTFNVIVSVATVLALYVFVDLYFEDRFAAFAAAAVLALQPISARHANSDSAVVLQTFCLVAGAAFLAGWNRRGNRAALLQGVAWLVLAANVRFESVVYLAVGALVVIGGGGWPRRGRTWPLVVGGLCGALFLLYPAGRALRTASGGVFEASPLGYLAVFLLSPHSPAVIVAVAFLGLGAATLTRFRAAVFLLLALVLVALPGFYFPKACGEFAHRYSLPALALWAAFAGCGCSAGRRLLARAARRARDLPAAAPDPAPTATPLLAAAAVLLLVVGAAVPHRAYFRQMWTHALEYRYVVAEVARLPDDVLIVGPDSDGESRGLRFSDQLSVEAGKRHRWLKVDDPQVLGRRLPPGTVYYQSTTCFAYQSGLRLDAPDWTGAERPVCRRMRELYALEPIATAALPSRSYTCEAHTVDPVPVGFYRVHPKPDGEGGRR